MYLENTQKKTNKIKTLASIFIYLPSLLFCKIYSCVSYRSFLSSNIYLIFFPFFNGTKILTCIKAKEEKKELFREKKNQNQIDEEQHERQQGEDEEEQLKKTYQIKVFF